MNKSQLPPDLLPVVRSKTRPPKKRGRHSKVEQELEDLDVYIYPPEWKETYTDFSAIAHKILSAAEQRESPRNHDFIFLRKRHDEDYTAPSNFWPTEGDGKIEEHWWRVW